MSKFCDIMIGICICIGVGLTAIAIFAFSTPGLVPVIRVVHYTNAISLSPVRYIRETIEYSNIVVAYYDTKGNWIVVNSYCTNDDRGIPVHGTDSEPWRFWEDGYPVW